MTKAKKAPRAKARPKKARVPSGPVPAEDANAASGALLALEAGRAPEPDGDGSVEDPLQDWPEAEGEPDRWLDERGGDDVQKMPDE
jgi:hypothetical protein